MKAEQSDKTSVAKHKKQVKAPENPKTDHKPIKGRRIFLDLAGYRGSATFEQNLKLLGACIENSFCKDVQILITKQGRTKDYERQNKAVGTTSAASPATPSLFNLAAIKGVESPQADSPGEPPAKALTRGQAIAAKAQLTKHYGSTNVVTNAKKWNMKIIHIEQAQKYVQRELEKVPREAKAQEERSDKPKHREYSENCATMQRVVECPVCYLVFDSKTCVPKTLACGHGFCSACLGTVLRGSTIKCPKCRTKCDVPNGKIEKLPTSYATLDTLDATCEECLDQVRSAQCNHCKLYLCNSCLQTHPDEPQSNLRDDLTSLKYQLRQLNEKVTNDDVVAQINIHGEATISQVNKTYADHIEQLKQQELDDVNNIRAQITKDCEAYLQWKQKFNKNYAEINDFLDCASSKVTLKQVTTVESEELVTQCREKCTQLDCLQKTEPKKARISFLASRKRHRNSDSFKCGTLIMEIPPLNLSTGDVITGEDPGHLDLPTGITITPNGDIILCDSENERVQLFNVPKL